MILGSILIVGFYFYTKYYFRNFVNDIAVITLITEIKTAETLPERFYELYEIDNPNSLTHSVNRQIFTGLFESHFMNPPSTMVAGLSGLSWKKNNSIGKRRYKLLELSLSWEIETKTTQRECLNWVMEKSYFLFKNVGIKQASEFYFKKKVSELDERELASLVVMMNNPRRYNPLRSEKLLNQKVDELLKK